MTINSLMAISQSPAFGPLANTTPAPAEDPATPSSPSSPTSPTTTLETGAQTAAPTASQGEEFSTFITLLTAQIRNQDPLAPLDSTQFVEQLATFSSLELQAESNVLLEDIAFLQAQLYLAEQAEDAETDTPSEPADPAEPDASS